MNFLKCISPQEAHNPSASADSMDISPGASETESSPMVLAVCASSEVLSVLSECGGIPTPVHSGSEHGDMLVSPPITQCSGSTPSTMFPTPPLSDRQPSSTFVVLSAKMHGQEESMLCMSPSSTPEKMCASEQQHLRNPVSTSLNGILEPGLNDAQQLMQQSSKCDCAVKFSCVTAASKIHHYSSSSFGSHQNSEFLV